MALLWHVMLAYSSQTVVTFVVIFWVNKYKPVLNNFKIFLVNILIFNGDPQNKPGCTGDKIAQQMQQVLESLHVTSTIFSIPDEAIPFFDTNLTEVPQSVQNMVGKFRAADRHIWLGPLYHGSIPGAMKNCLDWMELSAKENTPYLSNKIVALFCWAAGSQAMQGINTMDAVAKALRAWTLPYSVPAMRSDMFNGQGELSVEYHQKINLLVELLVKGI